MPVKTFLSFAVTLLMAHLDRVPRERLLRAAAGGRRRLPPARRLAAPADLSRAGDGLLPDAGDGRRAGRPDRGLPHRRDLDVRGAAASRSAFEHAAARAGARTRRAARARSDACRCLTAHRPSVRAGRRRRRGDLHQGRRLRPRSGSRSSRRRSSRPATPRPRASPRVSSSASPTSCARPVPERIELVTHSTTQAVNALLEGDVGIVGVIGIGRRPDLRKVAKRTRLAAVELAPGKRLRTAHEMLDVTDGLDPQAVEQALDRLVAAGAETIAVAEAFSPDDDSNEQAVAAQVVARGSAGVRIDRAHRPLRPGAPGGHRGHQRVDRAHRAADSGRGRAGCRRRGRGVAGDGDAR